MVLYFTGTGNSRYVAIKLAEKLGDTFVNSAHYIRMGENYTGTSEKAYVFVCPTYASYIPRAFEKFIESGNFAGNKQCYFVMTCGISNGQVGSAKRLHQLCNQKGLTFMGVKKVIMPENYITLFMAPPEKLAKKIIDGSLKVIQKIAEKVQKGTVLSTKEGFGLATELTNPLFYKLLTSDKKFRVKDSCIGCGKCEKVCPLANIKMQGGKPTWQGNCTQCQACIGVCPQKAIEYGIRSVGKRRYYLQ